MLYSYCDSYYHTGHKGTQTPCITLTALGCKPEDWEFLEKNKEKIYKSDFQYDWTAFVGIPKGHCCFGLTIDEILSTSVGTYGVTGKELERLALSSFPDKDFDSRFPEKGELWWIACIKEDVDHLIDKLIDIDSPISKLRRENISDFFERINCPYSEDVLDAARETFSKVYEISQSQNPPLLVSGELELATKLLNARELVPVPSGDTLENDPAAESAERYLENADEWTPGITTEQKERIAALIRMQERTDEDIRNELVSGCDQAFIEDVFVLQYAKILADQYNYCIGDKEAFDRKEMLSDFIRDVSESKLPLSGGLWPKTEKILSMISNDINSQEEEQKVSTLDDLIQDAIEESEELSDTKKQADPLVEKLENVIDMAKSYQGCGEAERGLCFVADDLKKILEYVKEKELKVER